MGGEGYKTGADNRRGIVLEDLFTLLTTMSWTKVFIVVFLVEQTVQKFSDVFY